VIYYDMIYVNTKKGRTTTLHKHISYNYGV